MVAISPRAHDPDPSQDPLWHRIEAFDLDAIDPVLSFTRRLAGDNGWTDEHAARVIEEYKRFCYLSVVAPQKILPSDQVEQAWLLHIAYSQNYWGVFCAQVLDCDLHHDPISVGDNDNDGENEDRLQDTYRVTLETYQRLSGEMPPPDIWPRPELLLAGQGAMRRVSTNESLIIRKPPKGILWVAQTLLIFATLYFLWQAYFVTAFIIGGLAGGIAVLRDSTDNKWVTKPWRDGDDDGTSSGGGSIRGI